ncbi:hypothetical protein PUNSTDRAFT_145028, partial [Punctularia strigosozonata HHB-11173 SS5]|uniref:uncharacterized protein n=1 Tax=Punctularia strigosozonata (strain HHB-11173) TaxID=741275 RepID=UPI00044180BB
MQHVVACTKAESEMSRRRFRVSTGVFPLRIYVQYPLRYRLLTSHHALYTIHARLCCPLGLCIFMYFLGSHTRSCTLSLESGHMSYE